MTPAATLPADAEIQAAATAAPGAAASWSEMLQAPADLQVWQVAALVGLALLVAVAVWLFFKDRVDPLLLARHRERLYDRVAAAAKAAAEGAPTPDSMIRATELLKVLRTEFGSLFADFPGVGAFVGEMKKAASVLPAEDRDPPTKTIKERAAEPAKTDARKKPYEIASDAAVAFRKFWCGTERDAHEVRRQRLQQIKEAQFKLGLLSDD